MKHFFANFIAMFFISKKLRRRIRVAIMHPETLSPKKINELKNPKEKIVQCESQITQKQHDDIDKEISEKQKILEDLEKKYNYLRLKSEWLTHNNGKLLLPGRFNEYDLVFCIGTTCYATSFLDYFKLRRFTNPFDWTGGMPPDNWETQPDIHRDSRFREKIQALCNNFKDYLNPKDFKYVSRWINPSGAHHCVVNIKTKIRYMHEFPTNQSIMQHMPEFIEKMQRRIDNLYTAIDKSQKILILWISEVGDLSTKLEQNVSDTDIKQAEKKLNKKYPDKKFDFVFFESDETKERFEYEKIAITPNAFRIKSNHFLTDSEYNFIYVATDQLPHTHVLSEMLDNIHLSKKAFKLPDKSIDS